MEPYRHTPMGLHDVYRNNFFFAGRGIRVGGLFRNKIHVLVFVSYFEVVVFHVPTVASSNCALLTAGSERTCAAYTAAVRTTAVAVLSGPVQLTLQLYL